MKEGWEYKKFNEVFDLQMGKTPDRKTPQYFEGDNVWVSIRDMGAKEISDSNEHISDEAIAASNIRKVKKGTVIMSFKLTVGKCAIAAKDLYTNEAIMAFNLKEGYNVKSDFLYYYLRAYKWTGANKAVMGMTLNKATISQHKFSIPPLSEQERIVSELDLLSSIIEKKKAQLQEYDQLAQSIFYDMFGDPVENEKGWEVKKLGEVCENCDSLRKPITAKDRIQGTIPYYGASGIVDYVEDYIFEGDYLLISEDGANLLARSTPIAFSIKGNAWVNNHAHVLKFSNLFVQQYVEYTINLRDISSIITGCAQPKLTQANLNSLSPSLPPTAICVED